MATTQTQYTQYTNERLGRDYFKIMEKGGIPPTGVKAYPRGISKYGRSKAELIAEAASIMGCKASLAKVYTDKGTLKGFSGLNIREKGKKVLEDMLKRGKEEIEKILGPSNTPHHKCRLPPDYHKIIGICAVNAVPRDEFSFGYKHTIEDD